MPYRVNLATLAIKAEKAAACMQAADNWAKGEGRTRTAAAKPTLLTTLDALEVTVDNLRSAIAAAHLFDVRALGDAIKVALVELERAEQRVARESELEVHTEN